MHSAEVINKAVMSLCHLITDNDRAATDQLTHSKDKYVNYCSDYIE
jgi:hypothetical protein